jgi:hypothetical protein
MKVKQINNQKMDGLAWIEMASQYIEAINTGMIPSIESSWTQICRTRAQTIFEKCIAQFEEVIALDLQMPLSERDLESGFEYHCDKLKTDILKALPDEKEIEEHYIMLLEEYLEPKLADLRSLNLSECRNIATSTLSQLFQELNQRFMADTSPASVSQNIKSLDYTLQEISTLYDGNVPEFGEKYLIFLTAKSSFLHDLVYFIHANLENENQAVNQSLNELKDRHHSAILEAKEGVRLEK